MSNQRRSELKNNQEFQSSIVRFVLLLFGVSFIVSATVAGDIDVDLELFLKLAMGYLVLSVVTFVSILWWPTSSWRLYLSIVGDIAANTVVLIFLGDPLSPFFLLYLWFSFYAGARFGHKPLLVAMITGGVVYATLLFVYDAWSTAPFDAGFYLMMLIIMPVYLHALLQRLMAARMAAEKANRARGDFLAHVSHELRTPLNGVIGMAWMLGNTRLDEEQSEYVSLLLNAAKSLQALIGDVLDLSKIDADKMDLQRIPFDPAEVLVEVCEAVDAQRAAKQLELVCDIDPRLPREVMGDDLRFRQIFLNLVDNAVKFTEQGAVVVRARVADPVPAVPKPHLVVDVEDTGSGMAPESMAHIFEPFVQGDSSATRVHGGSGLGTAIIQRLTRIMGGDIELDSTPGEGTKFTVRLPLLGDGYRPTPMPASGPLQGLTAAVLEPHDAAYAAVEYALRSQGMKVVRVPSARAFAELECCDLAVAVRAGRADAVTPRVLALGCPTVFFDQVTPLVQKDEPHNVRVLTKPYAARTLIHAVERLLRPETERGSSEADDTDASEPGLIPSASPMRVLVAEDDDLNARLITYLIEKSGHHPVVVADGQAALEAATEARFDLALVDVRMPRMSGIDFTRAYRLREDGVHRMKIVALTADATEDTRRDCLDAGADFVLTKPVSPAVLFRFLQNTERQLNPVPEPA